MILQANRGRPSFFFHPQARNKSLQWPGKLGKRKLYSVNRGRPSQKTKPAGVGARAICISSIQCKRRHSTANKFGECRNAFEISYCCLKVKQTGLPLGGAMIRLQNLPAFQMSVLYSNRLQRNDTVGQATKAPSRTPLSPPNKEQECLGSHLKHP